MASFRVNRSVRLRSGGRIGNINDYTGYSSCGIQTMAGSARVWKEVWIPATTLNLAAAASVYGLVGSPLVSVGGARFYIPTLSPSSTTCDMQFDTAFVAPPDMDTAATASPYVVVENVLTGAFTTANSGIGYQLNYNYVTNGSTTTAGSVSGTLAPTAACVAGARISGSLPLIPPAASPGQFMHLHFRMLTGACTGGANGDVVGIRFRYLSNKLGEAIS